MRPGERKGRVVKKKRETQQDKCGNCIEPFHFL